MASRPYIGKMFGFRLAAPAVLNPSATVGSPSPSSNVTPSSSPSTARSEDSSTLGPLNPGRASVTVLGRIPRPARDQIARRLSDILDQVTSSNCRAAWERLFLFCRNCLNSPPRRGHRRNLVAHIRRAIMEENNGSSSFKPSTQEFTFVSSKDPLRSLAARVAAKLEEGNFRGAVKIVSSDESFAPTDASTLSKLKEKHPPRHPLSDGSTSPDPRPTPQEVSSSQVLSAIRSFPAGSAGGPDGLRPQHLKDLVAGRSNLSSQIVLESLTRFVNFVLAGDILADARPYLFGASLVALNKSCGGVRPIAVGCTLRRLVAKCASFSVRDEMGLLLAPLQLGYGTPMGSEAAVHAARTYLHQIQPGHLLLKVDFKNAFNCIRRDKMLEAVLSEAPGIFNFVYAAYNQPSLLFFGKHILDSAEGVQQGDPLGPLLFSLTIHQLLVSLKSEFKIFYLDDGTIGGPLEDVVADFKRIEQVSDDLGLAINHSKSEVICVDDITRQGIQSISPMFQITDPADACLLGSPIGGPQSINQVLSTKKASLERLGERLRLLHSHDGLCLLKNALALPKVLYVLRTAPCF